MNFKNLHHQDKPLLIGNVWDVPSAKTAEALNFQAIGTSSSAIAALLGYKDGEEIAFSELKYIVSRIAQNTNLPLSVDLESGYSREPKEIAEHIKQLTDLGIVGINIEDSLVDNNRTIINADDFAKTLSQVSEILERDNIEIFINVRTDPFLLDLPNPIEETKNRIRLYEDAGVNGIFTPFIISSLDIKEIVDYTDLPINVLSIPNLPNFDTLNDLGVKRISLGNSLFGKMYQQYEIIVKDLLDQNSFKSII